MRLSVFRSSKHFSAQVINDEEGKTLCALSTCNKEARAALTGKKKTEQAAYIGGELAKLAIEAGVKQVVLDRGPYKYHGRVKAFAEAAREGGLGLPGTDARRRRWPPATGGCGWARSSRS